MGGALPERAPADNPIDIVQSLDIFVWLTHFFPVELVANFEKLGEITDF